MLNVNEFICEVLNNTDVISTCDEEVRSIEFMSNINTLRHIVNLPEVILVNEVTSQTIEIYVFEDFGLDDEGNPDTTEKSIEIFLCENHVPIRYMTNTGLSEKASEMIMQVIADATQKEWHLTFGKEVVKTLVPKNKKLL